MKKIFETCFVLLPLTFGCFVAIIHCVHQCIAYNDIYTMIMDSMAQGKDYIINPCFPIYSVYNLWIGNDGESQYAIILFWGMPLLSYISLGCMCNIKNTNEFLYLSNPRNYLSNYAKVFIWSGSMIGIPLLVNFLGMTLFIPSFTPDSIYDIYYRIFSNDFLSNCFYCKPLLYVIFFIVLDFVFYGLFGAVCLTLRTFSKLRILPFISPVLIMTVIEGFKRIMFPNLGVELSPLSFLFPAHSHNANIIIIFTEMAILLFFTLIMPITRGEDNES